MDLDIKGFKSRDGSIHKYDYNALANIPKDENPDSDGDTIIPHIGENGNWYIGDDDTGVKAAGTDGDDGGYYTPEITPNEADNSFTITFKASKSGMPAVAPATIKLHEESNDSGQNLYFEPADGDTPLVFFTGVKPTTKDNVLAEMVYISKGKIIKAYVKIKCQGSSSMNYAKKNFTVTLYQDEARTIPLYLEFKDWGIKVNKFVLKADWIDHSHSRNVCTARIWKDIVESRPDYDTLPEELKNAPGHGAIVGFPIAVYYNGNYEGIYNCNIGKDPWMWSMDEANPNHAMLCAEVNNAVGEVDWGFFAFPTVENCADTSSYAGANSMAITAYTENAQAAFDFILYAVTGTYGQKLVDNCKQIPADVSLTEATLAGSVDALLNTVKPMSWCGNIHSDRNQGYKDLSTQIFEGKFADGAAWCAAMDALN